MQPGFFIIAMTIPDARELAAFRHRRLAVAKELSIITMRGGRFGAPAGMRLYRADRAALPCP
jgi:hypothetical protein